MDLVKPYFPTPYILASKYVTVAAAAKSSEGSHHFTTLPLYCFEELSRMAGWYVHRARYICTGLEVVHAAAANIHSHSRFPAQEGGIKGS